MDQSRQFSSISPELLVHCELNLNNDYLHKIHPLALIRPNMAVPMLDVTYINFSSPFVFLTNTLAGGLCENAKSILSVISSLNRLHLNKIFEEESFLTKNVLI